jgi:hypothetical protein
MPRPRRRRSRREDIPVPIPKKDPVYGLQAGRWYTFGTKACSFIHRSQRPNR